MKFNITQLDITVDLNDEIVAEYEKIEPILETFFVICLLSEYGSKEKIHQISDSELSIICNKILLSDLKTFILLPKALECIENNLNIESHIPQEILLN